MRFLGTLCFLDNSNKGKRGEERGRICEARMFFERMPAANVCDYLPLEYEIERHIECQSAHLAGVLEGNHIVDLRVD